LVAPDAVVLNRLEWNLGSNTTQFIKVWVVATDTTPPVLAITAPAAGAVVGVTPIAVTGTVVDQTPTTVTVNGVVATRSGDNWSASVPLIQGSNTLTVLARDAAGKQTTLTRVVNLDAQGPLLVVTTPLDNAVVDVANVPFSGTVSDASSFTLNVNGQTITPLADGSFSGTRTLMLGANVLTFQATDGGGNATTVVRNVTYGLTPSQIAALSLTYACGNDFRAHNPNTKPAPITWDVVGTSETGGLTLPAAPSGEPYSETAFTTQNTGTVRMYYGSQSSTM
jgi:uncharacterized Zn-binding protein involved in type VI secretion